MSEATSEATMEWSLRETRETIGPGSIVMDTWELKEHLGQGGFGSVWLAEKNLIGVKGQAAIKIIRIPRNPSDIDAMRAEGFSESEIQAELRRNVENAVREIKAMIELKTHPAIVPCENFDVIQYEDDGTWEIDIQMQLLTALPDWTKTRDMKPADVVRLGLSLTDLLTVCESKHIMHRDIKPANIFVDQMDNFKLGDFGLARVISDAKSVHSRGVGAEAFMAPEVFKGEKYDHRADIYSLGLVMYWLLNGQSLPFTGKGETRSNAISRRLLGEALPALPGVDPKLNQIILKACDPDPKKRWQNAREFHEALKPDTKGTKIWKYIIAVIAVLALLFGGYKYFTYPRITAQPSASSVPVKGKATFKVDASGAGLTYQWYYRTPESSDWEAITLNGKSATYSFTAEEPDDGCYYYCKVTNSAGESVSSDSAKLTVLIKPVITTQPAAFSASDGKTATFKVEAVGTGLTYQWYRRKSEKSDWEAVPGNGKSDTYSFTTDTQYDGYYYYCKVTNSTGESVSSDPAKLTVYAKPVITTQPSAISVSEGKNATFKVAATGRGLTYQWYCKEPGTADWIPVSGNGSSSSYSLTTAAQHDGYYFYCKVTDSTGEFTLSDSAKLTVYAKPVITEQPSDVSVTEGQKATFKVTATGTGLAYQWYCKEPGADDWTVVSSKGTSASYSFTASALYDGYAYCCKVTNNSNESVWCSSAKLTVYTKPSITQQPSDVSVTVGKKATFKVAAAGTGLTYQWYYKEPGADDWTIVNSKGTSASYSFTPSSSRYDGYAYCCKVANRGGNYVWCNSAILNVFDKPSIITQPSDVSVTAGKTVTFSVTATGTGLTYQWYCKSPNSDDWTMIERNGTSASYSFTASAAYNGYAYCCKVTNGAGDYEWCNSAKLTMSTKPVITAQPSDVSVTEDQTATFRVAATGTGLTYQWYYKKPGAANWTIVSSKGTSASYSFTASALYDGYTYCCKITSSNDEYIWCDSVKLTVYTRPSITKQPSSVSVTAGNKATFKVTASGTGLTYQWYCKSPNSDDWTMIERNGTSASYSLTPTSSQYDGYTYCCKVTNRGGDYVWSSSVKLSVFYKPSITLNPSDISVTAGNKAFFRVTASGTGLTYQWYRKKPGTTDWILISSNGTSATYSFTATTTYDNYSYCCKVTNGAGDSVWCNSAKLSVCAMPVITKNPSSLSVTNGNKATFKVSATGKKLTYQWYYKWSGASDWYAVTGNGTSATYSFTASTAHNNYYYCCKVTNSAGDSVWSSSAKLSVYIKPTITDNPSDKTVYSGYTATFRVYATGTGLTYQWYRKKPGTTEWTSVGSSGTSSAYSFTAYSYYDGYSYCCKVTNGAGDSVWCNSAKLTVK